MEHWHWPQWLYAGLLGLMVVMHISNHGKEREYNGPIAFVDTCLTVWILYMGGFWS